MARSLGVVAFAIALLVPSFSAGVRSASLPGRPPRAGLAPQPERLRPLPRPFVSPLARSEPRKPRQAPPEGPRKLVLTFDDGPDLATTPLVLEALERHGFKAAFFVAGRRLIGSSRQARARRALLREIAARGHLVANHTVRHENLCLQPALIDDEIDHNQRILTQLLGAPPRLFRPPFGAHCPALDRALTQRQLISVGWTIDPQDWRRRDPQLVVEYVRQRLAAMEQNAVLLMHDTRPTGVRALPGILDWIAEERGRAERGEARPLEVLSPTALLPSVAPEPTGVEPLLSHIVEGLRVVSVAAP